MSVGDRTTSGGHVVGHLGATKGWSGSCLLQGDGPRLSANEN